MLLAAEVALAVSAVDVSVITVMVLRLSSVTAADSQSVVFKVWLAVSESLSDGMS